MPRNEILIGDCREMLATLPGCSVQCCVTSPPYWGLRDYALDDDGIGMEDTVEAYLQNMVVVFEEVRRVLRDDGTLWLNYGDRYNSALTRGSFGDQAKEERGYEAHGKPQPQLKMHAKNLLGLPWRVAFALQAAGWILRSDIIWAKPNPMPDSVRDRPTCAHEYLFLFSKKPKYFYDQDAVREAATVGNHWRSDRGARESHMPGKPNPHTGINRPSDVGNGRNRRTVWTIPTQPMSLAAKTSHLVRVSSDDVSDGMMHIVSLSCPCHADLFGPISSDFCGEHRSDMSSRIQHICGHPALAQWLDSEQAEMPPALHSLLGSLGSTLRRYFLSAIDRSRRIRKRDRALLTTAPCTPFVEKLPRIGDRREVPPFVAIHASMPGCSILPDEMAAHLQGRIPHRTVGTSSLPIPSDCLCAFYDKIDRESSHFATFPEKLVEPCILAGTSERGACAECGAPWERVVERSTADGERGKHARNFARQGMRTDHPDRDFEHNYVPETHTLGFRPSCDCDASTRPCIVLDPFFGSGTVGRVAEKHGRDWIGIEMNPKYVEIAKKRTRQTSLLARCHEMTEPSGS